MRGKRDCHCGLKKVEVRRGGNERDIWSRDDEIYTQNGKFMALRLTLHWPKFG